MRPARALILAGLLLAPLAALHAAAPANAPKNKACFDCHADKTLTGTNAQGKVVALFLDEAKFKAGVDAAVNDLKKAYDDFTADLK